MKLSIVILSYNEKEYIDEAVQSCLNQKMPFDYEIIIGDDGSNDGSLEIIESYKSQYPDIINYFVMERGNVGAVIAPLRATNVIKRAFSMAKGEYVTLVSADDVLLNENKLARQVDFLEKHKDYASCYTDYKRFGANQEDVICKQRASLASKTFWAACYVHISCFVFRYVEQAEMLDRFADDTGLIFSIMMKGKSKHLAGVDFGYRQRDASIMREMDMLELCIIELMIYQDVLNHGGMEKQSRAKFSSAMRYVYDNRSKLNNPKYEKYLINCKQYKNDIINDIYTENKYIKKFIKKAIFERDSYLFYRKVQRMAYILFER